MRLSPCLALLLATPFLAAQEPAQKGGFNQDQWNRAVGLGAGAGGMFGQRRVQLARPNGEAIAAAMTWLLDGDNQGSWEPIGVWGEVGGRAWTTAMAAMTLGAPYRYAKIRRLY